MRRHSHKASLLARMVKQKDIKAVQYLLGTDYNINIHEADDNGNTLLDLAEDSPIIAGMLRNYIKRKEND